MSEIKTYLNSDILKHYQDKLLYVKNNYEIIKEEALKIPIQEYLHPTVISYDNNYWNVYMIKKDSQNVDIKRYAPNTYHIVSDRVFANAVFSILKPNTNINLHKDNLNFLYRSHLGLDVPDDYKFYCNEVDITTQNGEINFFDLTHYHNGFNKSDKNRIVLLIDLLRIDFIEMMSLTYNKNLIKKFII